MSTDNTISTGNPFFAYALSLAANPNIKAEDIAPAVDALANTLEGIDARARAAAAPPEKKKKRRRSGGKVVGWPAGVSRNDYKVWKEAQQAKGVSEMLNPQEMKRQVDAGEYVIPESTEPAPSEAPAAKPAATPKASAPKRSQAVAKSGD